MTKVPVTEIYRDENINFYWMKMGEGMKKVSIETIYDVLFKNKKSSRTFSVQKDVKEELKKYIQINELDKKVLQNI